jgi:predicted nucleotidyltransferase component of viral defense system
MAFEDTFLKQAELLMRVLPAIAEDSRVALKGGTAINLFHRPLPRLSVDIDLTFLPICPREEALSEINDVLERLASRVKQTIRGSSVTCIWDQNAGMMVRLFVRKEAVQVKVEPNTVIRGAVFPAEESDLVGEAQKLFQLFVSIQTLSKADLFGGKICAALDRQHPRDLFDVALLLNDEGITDKIRTAFIVYLISHPRPIHELLNPRFRDIRTPYDNEFLGMVRVPVVYDELLTIRKKLVETVWTIPTENERRFLLSFKTGSPEWALLGIPHVPRLPAVQWKLLNIRNMSPTKRKEQLRQLTKVLQV